MRGLVNLLIVILVTYTLNSVPVNTSLLSFELLKPWDKISSEEQVPEDTEVTSYPIINFLPLEQIEYNNPTLIEIEMHSDKALTEEQLAQFKNNTTLTVFNSIEPMDYPLTDFLSADGELSGVDETMISDTEWHYKFALNVSSDQTRFFMGTYQVSVSVNDSSFGMIDEINFALSYYPDFDYNTAIATVNSDQIYTQVYYLNETKSFLVPVTRKLDSSSKFIRNTISTLSYEPPTNSRIFAQDINFPRMPRVYLSNGVLSCYLNSSETDAFTSASPESKLISEAIVKTLTDIGYVDNLTFYINDRQTGTFINGLPLKTIYNEDYTPYAYVNYYDNAGKGYLVPQPIADGQETAKDLLNILKTTHESVGNYGVLAATVPNTVELISDTTNNGTISLVFSDNLYTAYSDAPAIQQMMMDSIIQTITSLPSVDRVIITTETHSTGSIGTVALGQPLTANRFLNPTNQ